MQCLIIYESMYGHTHEIAESIGQGLAHVGDVRVSPVGAVSAGELEGLDLLIVGGPTHVHGMTRATSRKAALEEAESDETIELDPDAPGPGLREWLSTLDKTTGSAFAAFDTRIDKSVMLVGSAARGIAKRLRRLDYLEVLDPESFFVDSSSGPLHEGEADRARHWGTLLAHELARLTRQSKAT